jgi:hypothetical protein
MRTVFADSFYFFALENDQDPAHTRAVAFLQAYRGRLLTTGWVLTRWETDSRTLPTVRLSC